MLVRQPLYPLESLSNHARSLEMFTHSRSFAQIDGQKVGKEMCKNCDSTTIEELNTTLTNQRRALHRNDERISELEEMFHDSLHKEEELTAQNSDLINKNTALKQALLNAEAVAALSSKRIEAEQKAANALSDAVQGIAERNIRLTNRVDELTHEANHDAMTGLLNRRGLYEAIEEIQHDAEWDVKNGMLSQVWEVCVVDANNLKAMNDKYGHQAGDDLIKLIAEELVDAATTADSDSRLRIVARVGGDEFIVITRNGALLDTCNDYSVGKALWNPSDEHFDAASSIADSQMYESKVSFRETQRTKKTEKEES